MQETVWEWEWERVCVCEREREREREMHLGNGARNNYILKLWERVENKRERKWKRGRKIRKGGFGVT